MGKHVKASQTYAPGGAAGWACAVGEALAWLLLVIVALLLLAGAGATIL
jgi:hypothetical protein